MRTSRLRLIGLLLALVSTGFAGPTAAKPVAPAEVVRHVLDVPDNQLDYAKAKLAFDQIIDPSIDAASVLAQVDRMATAVLELVGPAAGDRAKITAVRKVIYESGPWNENRPFAYDMNDPHGQNIRNALLATYLATHRGNCTSMPMLFLILTDRMGLNHAALADAPLHFFIRYTDPAGHVFNIETTNGAHVTRDEWIRRLLPMSDRSIQSGAYLRPLTRRETVADMASTLLDYLIQTGRYEDAIEVAKVILANYPRNVYAMVKEGTAYAHMIEVEYASKYPDPTLIPRELRTRYEMLSRENETAFKSAEALGWQQTEYSGALAASPG